MPDDIETTYGAGSDTGASNENTGANETQQSVGTSVPAQGVVSDNVVVGAQNVPTTNVGANVNMGVNNGLNQQTGSQGGSTTGASVMQGSIGVTGQGAQSVNPNVSHNTPFPQFPYMNPYMFPYFSTPYNFPFNQAQPHYPPPQNTTVVASATTPVSSTATPVSSIAGTQPPVYTPPNQSHNTQPPTQPPFNPYFPFPGMNPTPPLPQMYTTVHSIKREELMLIGRDEGVWKGPDFNSWLQNVRDNISAKHLILDTDKVTQAKIQIHPSKGEFRNVINRCTDSHRLNNWDAFMSMLLKCVAPDKPISTIELFDEINRFEWESHETLGGAITELTKKIERLNSRVIREWGPRFEISADQIRLWSFFFLYSNLPRTDNSRRDYRKHHVPNLEMYDQIQHFNLKTDNRLNTPKLGSRRQSSRSASPQPIYNVKQKASNKTRKKSLSPGKRRGRSNSNSSVEENPDRKDLSEKNGKPRGSRGESSRRSRSKGRNTNQNSYKNRPQFQKRPESPQNTDSGNNNNKSSSQNSYYKKKCYNCYQWGHMTADCRFPKRTFDKNKNPNNRNPPNAVQSVTTESSGTRDGSPSLSPQHEADYPENYPTDSNTNF